nr:YqaE/Pmp3 family membrane protein [Rhizobium grahamii]
MDNIRILLPIILPPLFSAGRFRPALWLDVLLTLCGYIPEDHPCNMDEPPEMSARETLRIAGINVDDVAG